MENSNLKNLILAGFLVSIGIIFGYTIAGDFRFFIIKCFLLFENELSFGNNFSLKVYFFLGSISLLYEKEYGLDYSNLKVEKVLLIVSPPRI